MVSLEKITDKFEQLDEFLTLLYEIKKSTLVSFLKDKLLIGGAKYYLQVSIESCLDVANHIIAAEGFRAPKDFADAFKVLEENEVLDEELGMKLRQMAKFRNRLVRLYGDIDDTYVYAFITHDIPDIIAFKMIIANRYFK
jgi:uncharacterized protein YutE (UPF0331/DUF86 family)